MSKANKDKRPFDGERMFVALLNAALENNDQEAIDRITGMMMGAMMDDLMADYAKWCGETGIVRGPFLAMAEMFVEVVKSICDETDIEAAENLRKNTEFTMVEISTSKEASKQKKREPGEK